YRMEVCGPLSKLDEHGFNDKEGRRVEGVGGKVDFLGGFVKLSLPLAHGRLVCAAFKEHVGEVVHVVGVSAPHDGVLKIVRVLSAHVEGRQVYSDARE